MRPPVLLPFRTSRWLAGEIPQRPTAFRERADLLAGLPIPPRGVR